LSRIRILFWVSVAMVLETDSGASQHLLAPV
jgi:hypothetical protein